MKKLYSLMICVLASFMLAGCQDLDIIGNSSVVAFDALINSSPSVAADDVNGGWKLTMPDDSTSFFWSSDFSKSKVHDVAIIFDPEPFINAGLDITKLPADMVLGDALITGNNYTDEAPVYKGEITPIASYEQILLLKPEMIGYHDTAHHYMLHFGNGNMIMFARDIDTNEKGIVFMLNPEPFINSGVDINNVEGWDYGSYETMTTDGKKIMVERFVKSFDLR